MLPGFICHHVGRKGNPVLLVEHAADVEDITGWGLYCGASHHADNELGITDLDCFMDRDPALQELRITLQEGQFAMRTAPGQPWVIQALQDEAA
jgi:hypothetical protein